MKNKITQLPSDFPARVLSAITDKIIVLDKNFNIIIANNAPDDKMPDKKCYEFLYKIKKPCWQVFNIIGTCPIKCVSCAKKSYTIELQQVVGRKMIDVEASIHPIFGDDGEPVYFVEQVRDITKLKKMERKLKESKRNLEIKVKERTKSLQDASQKLVEAEKLASLGKMASAVAHELRNPMGVIRMAVYSLKKKLGDKNVALVKHLNNIDKNVVRSDSIIHDLLAFSRAQECEFVSCDINKILEAGLKSVSKQINEYGVKIVRELNNKIPKITADSGQLIEIFYNLFLNAIQAMEASEKRILEVISRQKENFAEIEISDTGCGVPQKNLKKLGESFFSTKTKGIGLGLYISYEIIKRHKGKIDIKSKVGKGTTFIIQLPIEQNNFNKM